MRTSKEAAMQTFETVTIGDRIFRLDADGYNAELDAYVVCDQDGRWVTIPA
jgi:hypothetical protein